MPTFIKTGFWEKGQKGYKGWLNLDELIGYNIAKSYTYADLLTMKSGSQLTPGGYYIISDFVTKYVIPGTASTINTTVHNGLPYGAMTGAENPAPPVEPLIVMAVSPNKFATVAYSTINRNDLIEYDFDANTILTETRRGTILNRIDTINNIQAPYDWRVVRQRRWYIDLTNASQRTTAAGIVDTTSFAGYFCWFSTPTVVGHIDTLTPPSATNFKDLFTFDTANYSVYNVSLGENASNVVFLQNCVQNIFDTKLNGIDSLSNCTFDSCWNNTWQYVQNSILIGTLGGFEIYTNLINFPIVNTLVVGVQIFNCTTIAVGGFQNKHNNTIGWYKVTGDYQTGAGSRRLFIRGMLIPSSSVSYRRFITGASDAAPFCSTDTSLRSSYFNSGSIGGKSFDLIVTSVGSAASFVNLSALSAAYKKINHQQASELYAIEQSVSGATVTLTPTKIF